MKRMRAWFAATHYFWLNWYSHKWHFRAEAGWRSPTPVLEFFVSFREPLHKRYGIRMVIHVGWPYFEWHIFPKIGIRWDGKELYGLDMGRRTA